MNNSARPSDRWIPWAILAFFASFMILLSGFAWIAFHTYPGQVAEDAYKQGLAYNTAIAHADAQEKRGWKTTLQTTPRGNNIDVAFTLRDAAGRAIDDARVIARAVRATQAGHDAQVVLQSSGKGHYHGTIALDWPGAWDIRISATHGTDNYQQSKTIVLQ